MRILKLIKILSISLIIPNVIFANNFVVKDSIDNGLDTTKKNTGVKLHTYGDFRVRFEHNQKLDKELNESRFREVIRLRVGFAVNIDQNFKVIGRLTTGSSDDPNSSDVTLGDFVNDLDVSFDQVGINYRLQNFEFNLGKFSNPFHGTDMVWDSDVNPQGAAILYKSNKLKPFQFKCSGMYFIIDEFTDPDITDSRMFGTQGELLLKQTNGIGFSIASGYYDYTLGKLSPDAGDTRSNLVTDSLDAYLSDYNLLNVLVVMNMNRIFPKYPIKLVGDFVENFGAAKDENKGFSFDIYIGSNYQKNDIQFRYGYAQTQTDAVLAAFSQDNTNIPTNYRQHTLSIDYVLFEEMKISAIWYLYKYNNVTNNNANPYNSRLRLNALFSF